MPRTIIPRESRLLAAVLFCAAAVFPVSCNTGKESYFFDLTDGTDDSTYVFSFGMKGFPSVYDVSFYTRLEGKNILIRSCANYAGLGADYYRTAVRTGPDNEQLLRALKEVL